jgi:hypothetical protein
MTDQEGTANAHFAVSTHIKEMGILTTWFLVEIS